MKWSDRFATGIEDLDRQHKMLFRMSEDYRETLSEGRGGAVYILMLDSLEDYARAHFGVEERCMFRYQCPAAQQNSEAHAQFVEALAHFRKRYDAAGFSLSDAYQVVDYIDEWLAHHIGGIDVQLKPCVERAEP